MNKLVLIAGGSTLVYACLAWTMGVWPGIELSKTPAGPGVEPLTAMQLEGRDVYVANGCSYWSPAKCPRKLFTAFSRSTSRKITATGPESTAAIRAVSCSISARRFANPVSSSW